MTGWPWLVLLGFAVVYDVTVALLRRQQRTSLQTLSSLYWRAANAHPWLHVVTLIVLTLLAAHLVFGLWGPAWAGWSLGGS